MTVSNNVLPSIQRACPYLVFRLVVISRGHRGSASSDALWMKLKFPTGSLYFYRHTVPDTDNSDSSPNVNSYQLFPEFALNTVNYSISRTCAIDEPATQEWKACTCTTHLDLSTVSLGTSGVRDFDNLCSRSSQHAFRPLGSWAGNEYVKLLLRVVKARHRSIPCYWTGGKDSLHLEELGICKCAFWVAKQLLSLECWQLMSTVER